jgi:heme exporter protein A
MHAIKISNLVKHFSSKSLFDNLSFEVQAGECLLLTGANGSGKSTLLNIIAGVVKAKGEIQVQKPLRYVSGTAMVDDFLTLEQNISLWLEGSDTIHEIMEEWGVSESKKTKAASLSLGQKKRVILGRSLANKAQIYLLDEPLSHLDEAGKIILKKVIERKMSDGACIVIASHQQDFFAALATKEIKLDEF